MLADAAASVGVIAAGVAALMWDANWVDPAVSLAIGALVLVSAWHLLRETTHVLLEGAPRGIDTNDVTRALEEDHSIESVHHVHVWNLASNTPALSAHVVVADEETLHDAQLHAERLKVMLRDRFGITHSTLELECHSCEPAPTRG